MVRFVRATFLPVLISLPTVAIAGSAGALITGLEIGTVPMFAAPGCVDDAPKTLTSSELTGRVVRILKASNHVSDGEPVEMLEIELDGARYCVKRADVRLSTDIAKEVPRKGKKQTAAAPIGASRGFGE